MTAPPILHELLDRAYEASGGLSEMRIYRVAAPGEKYVAEISHGNRRIVTPEQNQHVGGPDEWQVWSRPPQAWEKVEP